MKDALVRLLFHLLGNTNFKQHNIGYLYGASTSGHESRKKRWEAALARLYKDKDLLDFLYYQSESDKENVFKGKISADLARGARIRTLFIVFSAHRAYLNRIKRSNAQDKAENEQEQKELEGTYKQVTNVHSS